MIGIFDSGKGGLEALSELHKIAPDKDVCFFADTKNAPYGTKSRKELLTLVKRDVEILRDRGATQILMACCTASTVYDFLPSEMRKIAHPIIEPTAKEALRVTKNGKIGLIATNRTVDSGAFDSALYSLGKAHLSLSLKAQELVSIIEGGAADGRLSKEERESLEALLSPVRDSSVDTLILGCTHFPRLKGEIARLLPGIRLVSSALEGAKEILKYESDSGRGKTVFIR